MLDNLSELEPMLDLSSFSLESLGIFVGHLFVGLVLAWALSWHFSRFARTLGNRHVFARNFPLLILTVILVISVIKSSLALSLGLVGALSIVRFRTPVKDPLELAYLFLAIAIGIGLGANALVLTITATVVILGAGAVSLRRRSPDSGVGVQCALRGSGPQIPSPSAIESWFSGQGVAFQRLRTDLSKSHIEAVYTIEVSDSALPSLAEGIVNAFPDVTASFFHNRPIEGL